MATTRALLIVNPAAKHGETAGMLPVIERLLQTYPHDTLVTASMGEATKLAEMATGYDVIVAVGGDGTAHEVLNGIMRRDESDRPALGVIPTGSGNDTRRALGIPADVADAALVLASGNRHRFDVGVCNGVYFNNSFAAGLDARVTAKAVEYKITKKRTGLWLYLTALMHVLFHELYPHHVRISWEGEPEVQDDVLIVAATIGATYGGGFYITPDAVPDDGLLEVCTIDPLSLPQALVRLPFVIFGKHTHMKPVHMSRHTHFTIDCDDPMPAQLDGEVLVQRHFEIAVLPGGIECVVPGA